MLQFNSFSSVMYVHNNIMECNRYEIISKSMQNLVITVFSPVFIFFLFLENKLYIYIINSIKVYNNYNCVQ